jgi:hypothetical protein
VVDLRANISETVYKSLGPREGAPDDLVLPVALGLWWAT